ncbi:unnamed protein product, partial [Prorocentrum cordatum]
VPAHELRPRRPARAAPHGGRRAAAGERRRRARGSTGVRPAGGDRPLRRRRVCRAGRAGAVPRDRGAGAGRDHLH